MRGRKARGFIIAVDGPSGAGKSTVAFELAKAIKGRLLDTGATYRAVAYIGMKRRVHSEKGFETIAKETKFSLSRSGALLANGKKLGREIRTEKVSSLASQVSEIRRVRHELTKKQRAVGRKWSRKGPLVIEGRDIGTVVFPTTPHKFFITADERVRAKRRFHQLRGQGLKETGLAGILRKHRVRDERDSLRTIAPLKKAKDAILIDTSNLTVHEVVSLICGRLGRPWKK